MHNFQFSLHQPKGGQNRFENGVFLGEDSFNINTC